MDNRGQAIAINWDKNSNFWRENFLRCLRGLDYSDYQRLFEEALSGDIWVKTSSDYKGEQGFKTRAQGLRYIAFMKKEVLFFIKDQLNLIH